MGRIKKFHHRVSDLLGEFASQVAFDAVVEPPAEQHANIAWIVRPKSSYKGLYRYVIVTFLDESQPIFEIWAGADDDNETRFHRRLVQSVRLSKGQVWKSVKETLEEPMREAFSYAENLKEDDLEEEYWGRPQR